jgi:hypothetical protein
VASSHFNRWDYQRITNRGDKKMRYIVKVKYSENTGYVTTFEANLIKPNQYDILRKAVEIGKVSTNDIKLVEYAK